ncbi:hypothetical protein LOTGIDRAFT_152194 [Lottia gigantea]|uniref:Uncharacterized protein n=1 Tax=Lottia gigantea TaxID=225164 RepID=V4CS78_LOTGI|nr:hypothetical protein LOTGIDRAFT_152194 [Lottia gigantea]ESP05350.1 hypothetical protein LOTGIDRAFT_152194 [Lottia gigantea]
MKRNFDQIHVVSFVMLDNPELVREVGRTVLIQGMGIKQAERPSWYPYKWSNNVKTQAVWKMAVTILIVELINLNSTGVCASLIGRSEMDYYGLSRRTSSEPFAPGAPLPWSCVTDSHWKILGEHLYPSRILEVQCMSDTCWYGHYNCTSVVVSVQVLKLCLAARCSDHRIPTTLRRSWLFVDVDMSVGCQCTR